VTTAAEQILPGLLSGFRTRYPRLGIRLEAGNRDRVRGLLDRHEVDLVLGGRPEPGWDVEVLAVRAHQLVVVAAPGLAARAEPGPRPEPAAEAADPGAGPASPDASHLVPWLAGQAWLLREPGSGTRAATDALLTELDIAPLTLMVGSNGAIRESASVGLGVTLISRDAVAAELADGRLVPLPVPATPMHRDWYLVARADPPGALPPAAARLVAHVLAHGGFQPPARRAGASS
jgi:DNA-binding transcriptional LysR family regulator